MEKPQLVAVQRGERAVRQRKEEGWPSLKKWVEEERTILFVDESAIYLLPSLVRSWTPRGETLTLREWVSRDQLSSIVGINPVGELYLFFQTPAYDAEDVVGFLMYVLE